MNEKWEMFIICSFVCVCFLIGAPVRFLLRVSTRFFFSIEGFVLLRDRIFKSTVTVTAVAGRMCHGVIEWD